MPLPPIPSNVVQYIKEAASGTGLPESVVAAQNYVESDYGRNVGPSSAGAEGPWQFLPSTWSGLGEPAGQENNWSVSTQAYVKYMKQLLAQEHGNVRNALAAYNAGPANLQAGYGYADEILSLAGQSKSVSVGPSAATGDNTGGANTTSFLSWPGDITGFFRDAKTFVDALLWIVNPASWLRIGAFGFGVLLLVFAILLFVKVGSDEPLIKLPSTVPVPVPV